MYSNDHGPGLLAKASACAEERLVGSRLWVLDDVCCSWASRFVGLGLQDLEGLQ